MIYVFGGVNIDLLIKINGNARMHESNPSKITFKDGGVGRNVARAIGNYKPCELVSAFPNHLYQNIIKDLNSNNVSTKYSKIMSSGKRSMYIYVVDDNGVVIGASDMKIIEEISPEDVSLPVSLTSDSDIVIVDTNLSYDTVEYIVKNANGYKILDAVSSKKLEKVLDLVPLFDLVKVNKIEYEFIKDNPSKKVLLTTGDGLRIIEDEKEILSFTHKTLKPVNPNGCGDTLLGTYVANLDKGDIEAFKIAIIASAASSQTDDATPTLEEINKMNESELKIVWKEL